MGLRHITGGEAHDILGRRLPHLFQAVVSRPVHQGLASFLAFFQRIAAESRPVGDAAAALDDGTRNKVAGQWGRDERLDAHGAGALSHDGDVVRVATELGNVIFHPHQGRNLVQHAVVARDMVETFGGKGGMCQETKQSETIVEGDEHSSVLRPLYPVHLRFVAPSCDISSAMDPQGDRQFLARLPRRRCPHVEVQAVLAEFRIPVEEELRRVATRSMICLHSRMAEGISCLHALPGHYRLRFLPAQLSDRRCGVRNALVYCNAGDVGSDTLYLTAFNGENRIFLRTAGKHASCHAQHDEKMLSHNTVI